MGRWVKDCKVILGEPVVTQHRLLLTEFTLEGGISPKAHRKPVEKIKWHNLNNDNFERVVTPFVDQTKKWLQSNTDSEEHSPAQLWVALDNVQVKVFRRVHSTRTKRRGDGATKLKKQ